MILSIPLDISVHIVWIPDAGQLSTLVRFEWFVVSDLLKCYAYVI